MTLLPAPPVAVLCCPGCAPATSLLSSLPASRRRPRHPSTAVAEPAMGGILVSAVGVTGARSSVNSRVEHLLQEIKQVTDKPVAVGFGISTPEHVKQIAGWGADGVIIGSAIVKQLGEAASPEEGLKRIEEYAKNIKAACAMKWAVLS